MAKDARRNDQLKEVKVERYKSGEMALLLAGPVKYEIKKKLKKLSAKSENKEKTNESKKMF